MTALLAQGAPAGGVGAEAVLFWVFAVVGVGAALAMITLRNVVHGALMLVVNLLAIAVLFLVLQSAFLSIVQVIVYAGAIMVLFLFVIMLLGVDRDDLLASSRGNRLVAGVGGLLLAGLLLFAFIGSYTSGASRCGGEGGPAGGDAVACAGMDEALAAQEQGSVGVVAEAMFNRYTFPFEAAALLLVVATLGALILGRRRDPEPGEDPAYAPSGRLPAEATSPVEEAGDDDGGGRTRTQLRPGGGSEAPPNEAGGADGGRTRSAGGEPMPQGSSPGGGGSRHSESGRSADRGGEQ